MRKTALIFFLLSIFALTGISHAGGKILKKNGFSITLPEGWVEIPGEALDEYGKKAAIFVAGTKAVKYECGFQLGTLKDLFDYPHVLVQFEETGQIPESRLNFWEKFTSTSDLETGVMVYESKSNVLWMRVETNVASKGSIRGLMGMVPTQNGFIQVMGAALRNEYSIYDPVFQSITRSVKPDASIAYKFQLPKEFQKPANDKKNSMLHWSVILGAVVLSLSGGVLALILSRRKGSNE